MASSDKGETSWTCANPGCGKPATRECPKCLELDQKRTHFCSQECFRAAWPTHKRCHDFTRVARVVGVPGQPDKLIPRVSLPPQPETGMVFDLDPKTDLVRGRIGKPPDRDMIAWGGAKSGLRLGPDLSFVPRVPKVGEPVFVLSFGKPVRITSHFSCPARHMFGLDRGDCLELWNAAVKPRHVGGDGECEKLAQLGDAVLGASVVDVLQQLFPRETTRQIHQRKQQYVTNKALAQLDGRLHFSHFLPVLHGRDEDQKQSRAMFSDKQLGTIVEALIGAAYQHYVRKAQDLVSFNRIVRRLMMVMDDALKISEDCVLCGGPVISSDGSMLGLISCVSVNGLSFNDDAIVKFMNSSKC